MSEWILKLKSEIRTRAEQWASHRGLPFYRSLGNPPTIMFETALDDSHNGNFFMPVWKSIRETKGMENDWTKRLEKRHSRFEDLPEEHQAKAKELHSSNSSDALLMNCFCFPEVSSRIAASFALHPTDSTPEFGYKPCLSLAGGKVDATEIDMKMDGTLFEAKLTEADFTSRPASVLQCYTQFERCFDPEWLPRTPDGKIDGYQLVRNVLAAAEGNARLIVLIDWRRPDLLRQWWKVHSAVKDAELRNRCEVRFWQEVAAACEPRHKELLHEKYGL